MHMMLDLETLATTPDCVVTQIGWCIFHLDEKDYKAAGIYYPEPGYQIKTRRKVSWDTIAWWLKEERQAQLDMVQRETESVDVVLRRLCGDHDWDIIEGVWGHGATFDISILENMLRQYGFEVPWSHKAIRDTRTLFMLSGKVELVQAATKHNGRDDAIAQALTLQRAYKIIKGKK